MDYIDEIYHTLLDELTEEAAVSWVDPIWEDGVSGAAWEELLAARDRICDRLGVEEDPDVEMMIDCLLRIQRQVGRRMFLYGMRFRNE